MAGTRLARPRFRALWSLTLCGLLAGCGGSPDPSTDPDFDALPPLTQFTSDPGTERDATWSPDGQWIAFASGRSGNSDIWKKRADGKGEAVQITAGPSNELYPTWSPDGSRLAFTSDKGGAGNVWTIAADGGEMTRVTADADSVSLSSAGGSLVSWSPDGQWIAFESTRGQGDIWAIPASGGERRLIIGGPDPARHPSWSPDGEWIAFYAIRDNNADIWVVGSSGGRPRQITTDPATDTAPSWSPDGRWIAFQSMRSGYFHIHAIPSAGGQAVQLTDRSEVNDFVVRWSPDGARIAFNSQPAGGTLWVMPAAGGPAEPLGVHAGGMSIAVGGAWSPDGSRIAFIGSGLAEGSRGSDISVVSRSGGPARALTTGGPVLPGGLSSMDWSAGSDEIAFTRGQPTSDLWGMATEGGELWQLTFGPGDEAFPRYSLDGQRLAYAANSAAGAEDWDLWVMPAAGGLAERLLDWPTVEWGPSWSPDGQRLAFVSNRDRGGEDVLPWQVWTVSANGGDPRWLAEGCWPEWSPQGDDILFIRATMGDASGPLYRVKTTGGAPEPVLDDRSPKASPRWSPDGGEILYGERVGEVADIWIADVSSFLRDR